MGSGVYITLLRGKSLWEECSPCSIVYLDNHNKILSNQIAQYYSTTDCSSRLIYKYIHQGTKSF